MKKQKSKPSQKGPTASSYRAGDIYSFRSTPTTEFGLNDFCRYAALKILGLRDGRVCYVVLDGVFDSPPDLAQTSKLSWLRNSRFFFRGKPAWHCTPIDWENDLHDLRYVGNVPLSPEDRELFLASQGYGTWSGANHDAEGEWRWRNDRAAYEVARSNRARDERIAADHERYRMRLQAFTWESLLSEQPFARWNAHPPFPPPNFVDAARDRIHSAVRALQALGPTPRKPEVRAILKACVKCSMPKTASLAT